MTRFTVFRCALLNSWVFSLSPFHFLKLCFAFACDSWKHWEKGRGRKKRERFVASVVLCPTAMQADWHREVCEQRWRAVIALHYWVGRVVWCHCDHRNNPPTEMGGLITSVHKIGFASLCTTSFDAKADVMQAHWKSAEQPCCIFLASEGVPCYWRQW